MAIRGELHPGNRCGYFAGLAARDHQTAVLM
jgi:hypothetical protein